MVAAAAIAALAVLAVLLIGPRTGTLVISVAGPGNKEVAGVQVFIDQKKVCDSSPCIAREIPKGTHIVKVAAEGYGTTAGKAYRVDPGTETPVNITLAATGPGAGLYVKHEGSGLKLWVDGTEVGPLPQRVTDLDPGEHKIKIGGSERYQEYEETVSVRPNEVTEIEPKLEVLKGEATLEAGKGADGAKILLVSGDERRPLNKALPVRLEIGVEKQYKIVATKKGYEPYEKLIEFDDGKAEKTYVISLEAETEAPAASPVRRPAARGASRRAAPRTATRRAATGGKGALNINSIPASRVILDGVPKGSTPLVGVSVSPGRHTVVFMHPSHGRKVRSVNVQAGKTATAAVRFP